MSGYEWVTDEMFNRKLAEILGRMSGEQILLQIPEVYTEVSEHLNNQVLEELEKDRKTA